MAYQEIKRETRHTDDLSIMARTGDKCIEFEFYRILRSHKTVAANGEVIEVTRFYQSTDDDETTDLNQATPWIFGSIWTDGEMVWNTHPDENLHLKNLKEVKIATAAMLDCYNWAAGWLPYWTGPTE